MRTRVIVATIALAGLAALAAPAGALAAARPSGMPANGTLYGVTALSSSNAWAVGFSFNGTAGQTMIEHWNGSSWRLVASPNPAGSSHDNNLYGVAATSSTNAWAVGGYRTPSNVGRTLILHWNGRA